MAGAVLRGNERKGPDERQVESEEEDEEEEVPGEGAAMRVGHGVGWYQGALTSLSSPHPWTPQPLL